MMAEAGVSAIDKTPVMLREDKMERNMVVMGCFTILTPMDHTKVCFEKYQHQTDSDRAM